MTFPQFPEPEDTSVAGIFFHTEDVEFVLAHPDLNANWLMQIIKSEDASSGTINFIFCSDTYLLEINKSYLDHDYFTDVITFQNSETLVEGDIFISIDRIADNAAQLKIAFETELHRVMAHGVLHLLGYKDKTPEDQKLMTAKEDWALAVLSKFQ